MEKEQLYQLMIDALNESKKQTALLQEISNKINNGVVYVNGTAGDLACITGSPAHYTGSPITNVPSPGKTIYKGFTGNDY